MQLDFEISIRYINLLVLEKKAGLCCMLDWSPSFPICFSFEFTYCIKIDVAKGKPKFV